jgi:hypothetical protein
MDRYKLKLMIKENARQENIGFFITESRKKIKSHAKAHHTFRTSDGHTVDVSIHTKKNGSGKAVYHNRELNGIVKTLHWFHPAGHPTNDELENDLHHDKKLYENIEYNRMDSDTGGRIAEKHAILKMIDFKHEQNGTLGSDEHKSELLPHMEELSKLSEGRHPDHVQLRRMHGHAMADASLDHIKSIHGKNAKILRVGSVSKPGDIGKFTNDRHTDGQENPSDFAVEVHSHPENQTHFHGFSLKSLGSGSTHTTRQPGINLDNMLDHPSRKLETEKISREANQNVADRMNLGHMSPAERGRHIDTIRASEGKTSRSSIEVKANGYAQAGKAAVAEELHNHIQHLTTNVGEEGRHIIGKMLKRHLGLDSTMPYATVKAKGKTPEKTKVQITNNDALDKVISNPKTRYSSQRKGSVVNIFAHHEDKVVHIAKYDNKPHSNVLKNAVNYFNVRMGNNSSTNEPDPKH